MELAARLPVADGWLNRAAAADHRAQALCDPASQTRVIDLYPIDGDALLAAIDDGDRRLDIAPDRRLA